MKKIKPKITKAPRPGFNEKKEPPFESAIRPDPEVQKPKAMIKEPEIILKEKGGFRLWQRGYKLKRNEMITQHPNIYIGTMVVRRKK